METNNPLLKENGRLRKEIAGYQTALEVMELRAKQAEASAKGLRKRLNKIRDAVVTVAEDESEAG